MYQHRSSYTVPDPSRDPEISELSIQIRRRIRGRGRGRIWIRIRIFSPNPLPSLSDQMNIHSLALTRSLALTSNHTVHLHLRHDHRPPTTDYLQRDYQTYMMWSVETSRLQILVKTFDFNFNFNFLRFTTTIHHYATTLSPRYHAITVHHAITTHPPTHPRHHFVS